MPILDLLKLTDGLSVMWSSYLRDWNRMRRAANHPETTRYNYLLAAAQLARYLADESPDPGAAAGDPCAVKRADVEAFQAWMIDIRSAGTALNNAAAYWSRAQLPGRLYPLVSGLVAAGARIRMPVTVARH